MLAIFLGALDQTIVAVSMPAISAQFNDVNLLAWVISGYMVAMTVAVPIYGKAESLNLAMAATVCLFASGRALHEPHGSTAASV